MNDVLTAIVYAAPVVGGVGVVCAAALAVAAKVFLVKEDPRIEKATDILPGANCGGCGYAGCADYAKAIVVDGAPINLCAPGGAGVIEELSALLGVTAEMRERQVAFVMCGGDANKAGRKFKYNGVADCRSANLVGGGDKICAFGCLGYGTCSRVCPVDAIEITPLGLAVVHPETCIGCGACVKVCPRSLIKLIPESRNIHVLCNSRAKGPVTKQSCSVGCIGCMKCVKACENEEIVMDGPLAVVDYGKESPAPSVIQGCPTGCILHYTDDGIVSGKKAAPREQEAAA